MHHQGSNSGSGSGAANRGTTPPSIAPAPPPQSPQGQQQVQTTQVQMQQQQQNNSGGAGGNAGGGQGGQANVQQQQNVAPAPNNNMTTMAAAAIQQTQMQQQQQQMAPPQAPTQQTLTHPHSAMHQVSEWGHGRVQVIQQPLQNPTYLQQIYNTQGQLLMPGNIALHPAGMNPSIQVIAAGKPFQPNQLAQHMITTQGKSVLQGQTASFPGYATIPTTSNQTLVISQLGVISSQPNILPAHAHGQGGKPGDMQKILGAGGKSNMVSSNGMGGGAVGNSVGGGAGGVKGANNQQQQQCVVSQPQLITTQAPTAAMLGSQAQLISPIQFPWQAFGTPGIAWATPGGLQSPAALLTTPNPIFIRGAQPHDPNAQGGQGPTATQGGVFIQSPPPQAMATHNATLAGNHNAMQNANNAANTGAGNQGNGNNQQHQAQQQQQQITHQIHHQHQLAMKQVASVGTGSNRVGTVDGSGGTTVGGTTMQANIQPKTSAANNVLPPRSMSGILPGSTGVPNIRPASSVSTQTGSSGGPGGMGMGQLQMQKGLSKVRIKPTMNRASPAPSMKADAANQTKPQPISPANMQHQAQQLTAVAAQVSVANRMILTNASGTGAPLLQDKGQQLTLQAVKSFTSSAASTTSTTTSTSTSCSPAPTLPILPPLGPPTAVLLPHHSIQAQLIGQAACPPSPSGAQNGPNVSVASPMRPVGAPTPSGIVASLPVSISLQAPPSSPSQHLHPSQHQLMGPPMVAMVTAAPSPNQGMQNVPGSNPPVSVVTSSTGMGGAAPGTVLSVVPGGIVNNQVPGKEDSGASMSGDVSMNNVGDVNGSMMISEDRRNGEASPAPGVTPMEGVVETGVANSQSSEVNGDKEKMTNGIMETSNGGTTPMEGVNSGEEGGVKSENTSAISSGVTNGPTSGGLTGVGSRDTHKVPPPKALVKPQVLTHVIEGFVIQEASEPFAVNRSSLLSEMPQPSLKPNNQMMQNHNSQQTGAQDKENVQHHVIANHLVSPSSNDSEEPPKKKLAQEVQVGVPQTAKLPADLAKCEFCGKVDLRSKFKKSKRFCTLACAKSKRLGLYKPDEGAGKKGTNAVEPNNVSAAVNSANVKDQQAKTDWQKSKGQEWNTNQNANGQEGGRLGSGNVNAQEEGNLTTDNETNDSSGAESSSLSPSEAVQGQEATSARTSGIVGGDPSDDNNSSESGLLSSGCPANATPSTPPQPRINPIKWTVSDVCEFIRNLPGCSDYAEDFAIQEIDGQALLLLKEDHLMTAMSMKLGPALKICARIDTMRGDMKEK